MKKAIILGRKRKILINTPERLLIELDNHRYESKQVRSNCFITTIIEKLVTIKRS